MSDLVKKAAKGYKKPMLELYEANKTRVYYVACCLVGEKKASEALASAFKNTFKDAKGLHIREVNEFEKLLSQRLLGFGKKNELKSNPKAFKVPQYRNFVVPNDAKRTAEDLAAYINALPVLNRYIFVLSHIAGLPNADIAAELTLDSSTPDLALAEDAINFDRLKTAGCGKTFDDILGEIDSNLSATVVPESADKEIYDFIDIFSKPAESKKGKKTLIIVLVLAVAAAVALGALAVYYFSQKKDETQTEASVMTEPVINLNETSLYYADIEIQDYGTVTVELDQSSAPITVANFIYLARMGFYDGLTFHRIIDGFMMQGGDPEGDGTGGSEVCIFGEFYTNEYFNNSISHTRGTISMARGSGGNSASSQFFICQADCTSLDGSYAAFGSVTEGMDIVDQICADANPTDDNGTIEASQQPVITSITIREVEEGRVIDADADTDDEAEATDDANETDVTENEETVSEEEAASDDTTDMTDDEAEAVDDSDAGEASSDAVDSTESGASDEAAD